MEQDPVSQLLYSQTGGVGKEKTLMESAARSCPNCRTLVSSDLIKVSASEPRGLVH